MRKHAGLLHVLSILTLSRIMPLLVWTQGKPLVLKNLLGSVTLKRTPVHYGSIILNIFGILLHNWLVFYGNCWARSLYICPMKAPQRLCAISYKTVPKTMEKSFVLHVPRTCPSMTPRIVVRSRQHYWLRLHRFHQILPPRIKRNKSDALDTSTPPQYNTDSTVAIFVMKGKSNDQT